MAKKTSMVQAARDYAKAISGISNATTNLVTQCVTACKNHWRGEIPAKADINEFAEKVAEIRGWSESSAKPRKSEVRKFVRNYTRMESACKAVAAKTERFSWHDARKVATILNGKPKITDAGVVKAFFASNPVSHATPKQKAMRSLKTFMDSTSGAADIKGLQQVIQTYLTDNDITL